MPVIHTSVTTDLSPAEALRTLTDFGPGRADAFPNVDQSTLIVHEVGDTWADVTEGNKLGWERERYDWDAGAGTITAVTTESNLWAPGSRWDYRITPEGTEQRDQGADEVAHQAVGVPLQPHLNFAAAALRGDPVIPP